MNLRIEGILLTMVDARTNYARDISQLVIDTYFVPASLFRFVRQRSVQKVLAFTSMIRKERLLMRIAH